MSMDLTGFSPGPFHLSAYRDAWMLRAATLLLAALLLTPALAAQDFSHPDTEPAPQAALIQQANDALAASDFPAAFKILTGLNTQLPNNPQVLYDLGLTLEALGPETPTPTAPDSKIPTARVLLSPIHLRQPALSRPARRARPAAGTHRPPRRSAQRAAHCHHTRRRCARPPRPRLPRAGQAGPAIHSTQPRRGLLELLAALNLTTEAPEDILLSAEIAESPPTCLPPSSAYRRYLALPEEAGDPQAIAALAHVLLGEHHPADAEALLTPALAAHPADPVSHRPACPRLHQLRRSRQGRAGRTATGIPARRQSPATPTSPACSLASISIPAIPTRPTRSTPPLSPPRLTTPTPPCSTTAPRPCSACTAPPKPRSCSSRPSPTPPPFPPPPRSATPPPTSPSPPPKSTTPELLCKRCRFVLQCSHLRHRHSFLRQRRMMSLHQNTSAVDLYKKFLAAAGGDFPDQESQARQRLAALEHAK